MDPSVVWVPGETQFAFSLPPQFSTDTITKGYITHVRKELPSVAAPGVWFDSIIWQEVEYAEAFSGFPQSFQADVVVVSQIYQAASVNFFYLSCPFGVT